MKKLLLILLCLPMIFSCGEKEKDNEFSEKIKKLEDKIDELEKKEDKIEKSENSWPKYITDLPIGIDVHHSSDTVYAQRSNRADTTVYPYIWGFGTTVMAINQDLEIIEFGAYDLEEGEWVLRTQEDNRPFNKDEFIKWYHCNDKGIIYRGFKYSDNQNYLGKARFLDGYKKKTLCYFIGENEQGKKYVGAKEVIVVNNLQ